MDDTWTPEDAPLMKYPEYFLFIWDEQENLDFLAKDDGTHLLERDVYVTSSVNVPTYYNVP